MSYTSARSLRPPGKLRRLKNTSEQVIGGLLNQKRNVASFKLEERRSMSSGTAAPGGPTHRGESVWPSGTALGW